MVVSHDRHLLKTTTEMLLLVANGEVKEFDGDLDDYRVWLNQAESPPYPPANNQATNGSNEKTSDRKEQKRQEAETRNARSAQRRPLEIALREIEKTLGKLNEEKQSLDRLLASESIYLDARKEELKLALRRQAELGAKLDEFEEQWLMHQHELETL